jgi:Fe-S oxidoreductase
MADSGAANDQPMRDFLNFLERVAKIKAEQLRATGAQLVCTMCHNCIDGLNDVIKHYKLPMRVVQVLELVANAVVLPGPAKE